MFVYCIPFTVLNFEIFPGLVRKGMLIMVRLGKPKRRFRLTITHNIYLPGQVYRPWNVFGATDR